MSVSDRDAPLVTVRLGTPRARLWTNGTVINGPFAKSKELVAGYWILEVKSTDEAVEWANRVPFEALSRIYPGEYGADGEIEIRQLFELEGSDPSN